MQTFARWSDGMPGERVDTEAFLCQLLPEWGQGQIWWWCHTDAGTDAGDPDISQLLSQVSVEGY